MSDGFGEGFEQRPIRTSLGELYVHLWQFKDYFVRTGQEMEVMRRMQVTPQPKTPKHHRGVDAR